MVSEISKSRVTAVDVPVPSCSGCGAPLMGRADEMARLEGLVGDAPSVWLAQRMIDRIDELERWSRPDSGRCYVCEIVFQVVGRSKYWQGVESDRQAELARRKRIMEW